MGTGARIAFGDYVFDAGTRELIRGGQPLALPPKAFDLLAALLECRPEALSRADLHRRLWPDTHVSQTSLNRLIAELRLALGDDARRPRLIRTVHRFGYAFSGEATPIEARPAAPPAGTAACWLTWGTLVIPLPEGEHVLGRDPEAAVPIASARASRHHARIRITQGRAVLEDLGSKNGTYLDGSSIEQPAELRTGSEICIGSDVLVFHAASRTASTETKTRG